MLADKQFRYVLLGLLFIVITLSLLGFTLFIRLRAPDIGDQIGETNGKIVGTAVGSYQGVTQGIKDGAEAGTQAGLSAEDTTVDIKGTFESIKKLEILKAGVTLKNISSIGEDYKGLYIINGNANFSVDLNEAEISFSQDGKNVYIWIPEPTIEYFLDQSSTEKLAETQHFSFGTGAKEGLEAYLNSMAKTYENAKDKISNYDSLMNTAKESAKKQIALLVGTVCGENKTVHVEFK